MSEVPGHIEHILFIYVYEMHYSERFHITMSSDLRTVFQERYFFMKTYEVFSFPEKTA